MQACTAALCFAPTITRLLPLASCAWPFSLFLCDPLCSKALLLPLSRLFYLVRCICWLPGSRRWTVSRCLAGAFSAPCRSLRRYCCCAGNGPRCKRCCCAHARSHCGAWGCWPARRCWACNCGFFYGHHCTGAHCQCRSGISCCRWSWCWLAGCCLENNSPACSGWPLCWQPSGYCTKYGGRGACLGKLGS